MNGAASRPVRYGACRGLTHPTLPYDVSRIACHTRSGVAGMSRWVTP